MMSADSTLCTAFLGRDPLPQLPSGFDFNDILEKRVAEYFGAPFGVSVDSCTHGIELCLKLTGAKYISCPIHTYVSVPMLANKMNLPLFWRDEAWQDYYNVSGNIYDAAVMWKQNSYIPNTFMCLSFQRQKHLNLGKGGLILCPDYMSYNQLIKMSYDGRNRRKPWREQDIQTFGYHYYLLPEVAEQGIKIFDEVKDKTPKQWRVNDWPDISQMDVFKNTI